jgi:hypothetical protein
MTWRAVRKRSQKKDFAVGVEQTAKADQLARFATEMGGRRRVTSRTKAGALPYCQIRTVPATLGSPLATVGTGSEVVFG